MEFDQTSVSPDTGDAGQTGAEGQSTVTPATPTDTGVQAAPATQPVKQPQSREDNAAFKALRQRAESAEKRLNDVVQFGWQGQYTPDVIVSEIEAANARQMYETDPVKATQQTLQAMLAEHPDIQAARAFNHAQMIERDARALAAKAPELGIKDGESLCAYMDANPEVSELVDKGWTPERAIWAVKGEEISTKRAEKARQDGQQEAISKLQANANASPGPVGQGGGGDSEITFTDAQFNNPDQRRLVRDDRYYGAYMAELRRRTKG